MKLVVDATSQRVVGAHMIGADAGEVIQGIAIAREARRDQGAVRRHDRHPSHGGGGVRHHAREGLVTRMARRPREGGGPCS